MKKLLFIEASPRAENSFSSQVAEHFIAHMTKAKPIFNVDRLHLWSSHLPEFDGELLTAKYAVLGKHEHTAAQVQAWAEVAQMAQRFKDADLIVIATPMWNKSIPYRLKHYIDLITQPGITFSFSPAAGYNGLTLDRPVILVTASAGVYTDASDIKDQDFLLPYMENWLGFIGINNVKRIEVAPTVGQHDNIVRAKENALEQAELLTITLGGAINHD